MRARRGFTLIELLVSLAIVVAATAFALPAFTRTSGVELTAGARTLAAALRAARAEAVLSGRPATLEIDLERRELRLAGRPPRHLGERLAIELLTARSELTGERSGAIRFFPDGSSSGGRVTLATGTRRLLVDVAWLTGRVRILEDEER